VCTAIDHRVLILVRQRVHMERAEMTATIQLAMAVMVVCLNSAFG